MNKLLLARRLFEMGREHLASSNDLSLSIGINLAQDSVEAFLLAVGEHVNAEIKSGTTFEKYFDLINAKLAPQELPFHARLSALNRLRVNSKHAGLAPAKSETEGLVEVIHEFFNEVARSALGISLEAVSLVHLLRDGEAKDFLTEAEAAYKRGDFATSLIECRKALYVRVESQYDVSHFAEGAPQQNLGLLSALWGIKAPFYARDKKYVEENVKDPTDFIVFDHSDLELHLLKSGIDSTLFWNVWRLTPEVHRKDDKSAWTVKDDFAKVDKDGLQDRTEYVLDSTIAMLGAADQKLAATRTTGYQRFSVNLVTEQVPIYEKADSKSKVVAISPPGITTVDTDFAIAGLNGGYFWHVWIHREDLFAAGYVDASLVEART